MSKVESISVPVGQALTNVDDTNVTLTLGGTPTTALLKASSLTLGWTGTLAETRGGTNQSTYTTGDLLYASAANILSKLADVSVGSYLRSDGVTTAPLWSTLKLPNTATTGRLVYTTATDTYGDLSTALFDGTTLILGGTATVLSDEVWSFQKSQNTSTRLGVTNATSGTAARALISVISPTSTSVTMSAVSALYTTSTILVANTGAITSNMVGGLNIGSTTNSQLSFWTNTVERARFLSTGQFIVGAKALLGSEFVSIQKSQNASTHIQVKNATSGTAATTGVYCTDASNNNVFMENISALYTTSGIRVAATGVVGTGQTGGMNIGTTVNTQLSFWTNNTKKITVPAAGGIVIGTAALTTTATNGFLYIPTCAGTPTGVPTTQTGTVAMIYDTTNNKFYIYNGGWKGGTAPGAWS